MQQEVNITKTPKWKIFEKDNVEFKNDFDLSNFCNEYFINVGMDLNKKINTSQQPFKLCTNTSTNASMLLKYH